MLQIENYKPATQSELATIYNLLYRGFVPTIQKQARIKFKKENPNAEIWDFELAKKSVGIWKDYKGETADGYAGVLAENIDMIDFDDQRHAQRAYELCQKGLFKAPILKTTKGYHFYFLQNGLYPIVKNCTRVNLTCGLIADIKIGSNNAIDNLCNGGITREWLNLNSDLQVVPAFLLPCKKSYKSYDTNNDLHLLGAKEGDARNEMLYNHVLTLLRTLELKDQPYKDTVKKVGYFINENIFAQPLPQNELEGDDDNEGVLRADSLNRNAYSSSNAENEPKKSQINKICDELQALGSYKYDSFTNQTFYNDKQVNDLVVTKIRHDMTMTASADNVIASINYLADQNKFDSMNELLDKLPAWDNVKRCEEFFIRYCGADDSRYSRLCGLYFWTSLYNRAYGATPFKADTSIVLKGKQGIYKSTLLDVLSFGYCGAVDFKKKYDDNVRAMQAKVICEVAELKGMSNADVNDLKDFLSKTVDRYTPKFANYEREFVRRCVFVMTTNEANFLRDVTGNRRYAVIECTKEIELEQVKADLKQLWAEAKTLKFDLELVKELEKEIVKIQQNYIELPLYHEQIVKLLEERQTSTNTAFTSKPLTTQTICDYLHVTVLNKNIKNEISKSMKLLGYDLKLQRLKGKIEGGDNRFYLWVKS